jgi:[protein-PII] uridylyltransferase
VLAEIENGTNPEYALANDLMRNIQPNHRDVLYFALFLHDIAKGRVEDHSSRARGSPAILALLRFSAAETETMAWLVERHLVMSTIAVARPVRPQDGRYLAHRAIAGAHVAAHHLTTADIRAVGPGVWNGGKAQLLRALYYETEPALTGGFSEVDRARRVAIAQAEFRAEVADWPPRDVDRYIARHYPAYWLKVDLPHKIAHAEFVRAAEQEGKSLATNVRFDTDRGVTLVTVLAPDHPRLLSVIAGACAVTGANIVDAQIYTTTDGMALDTIAITREFPLDADEERRADRIATAMENALRGDLRLPDVVAKRAAPKGRIRAFAVEPEVTINNQWSNRYTVVEVGGLDRPGLLYELTATLSKLNLNIASAHVATFGERAVDAFYVTDLMGAKIATPTRNAAIKRALIAAAPPPQEARHRVWWAQ